jgi:fibronectin-binding autotransporter adhesin
MFATLSVKKCITFHMAGNEMTSIRGSAFVFALTTDLLALLIFGVAAAPTYAATATWNNTGTDFNTGANWTGGTGTGGIPGAADNATFTGAEVTNPNLSLADTIQGLTFALGASGYTLSSSGPSLTLTNTGTTTSSAINAANTSGTDTISANIILGGAAATLATLTQAAGGTLVISGNISSTNAITGLALATGGTYTLSGTNSYSGTTTLNGATLNIGNNSALSTGALVIGNALAVLDASGADRTLTNGLTINNSFAFTGTNNLTLSGAASMGASRTIALNSTTGKTLTLGTLSNTANANTSLTVNGANKLILGGLNMMSSTATAARVLTIDGSGTVEVTGVVANGGSSFNHEMRYFGTGTIILDGANTYAGLTRVISGTMQLNGSINNSSGLEIGQSGAASGKFILGGASGAVNQTVPRFFEAADHGTLNVLVGGASSISTLTVNNSSNTDTFHGIIGGTGTNENNIGITKAGSTVWTLTANNSYNGPTTLQAGGLTITGQQTGTGATSITGGTLTVSGTGSINGTSGISINGSGAKLLYTSNTAMTGSIPITLTQGTVDGTNALGALSVGNNASNILANGNGGNGALTLSSLAFGGAATVNVRTASPGIVVTGALSTTPASGTVTINPTTTTGSWLTGPNPLISYGSFGGSISDFTLGSITGSLTSRQAYGGLVNTGSSIALQVNGDLPKWTGLDSGNWVVGTTGANSNWKLVTGGTATDYIEGDQVQFDDSATSATTLSGGMVAIDINAANVAPTNATFNNSVLNYTVGSSGSFGIAGSASLTKSGTGTLTINTANSYTGTTVFNGGALILGSATSNLGDGPVTIGTGSAKTLNNTSGSPITLSTTTQTWNDDFTFIGSNDLNMGTGAVTLSGATRTITVSGSRLTVGGLQGGSSTALAVSGAGILAIGNSTVGGLSGGGTIENNAAANATLTVNQNTDGTFNGTLQNGVGNTLGFTKQGTAKLTLTGTNSYTGTTSLAGGTLVAANIASLGNTARLNITGNNTTFIFATDADTASPLGFGLSSTNTVTIVSDRATPGAAVNRTMTTPSGLGNGQINFTSGANVTSGTGRITFNQFGLAAGGAGTTIVNPTGVNLSLGDISKTSSTPAQTIELSGTATANEVTGVISNGAATISLTKSGTSTWTLSADNTYTGTTTISGGTLVLGNGGSSGTLGTGAVTNNGTLSYNRSDTALVDSHAISGTGSVRQIGAGKTTLSGVNTYSGPTVITAGTLAVTGSINNSAVTVTSGALDGTGSVGATTVADLAANILANGNGGAGTLTLSSLAFGGDATVNATRVSSTSPFAVTNALTTTPANGQVTINGSGTWTSGLNNLISFGSFGGSISNFSLGSITGLSSRQSVGSLALNGNNIALNIIGDILKWTGKDDGNWAVGLNGTLKNWKLTSGPATDYLEGDEVMLDDTATGTTVIDLGTNVSPGSVTFNNSTKNYTLNSAGGNGILTNTLTKSGTGSLTINTANSYTLGTTFNGGTLNLGNAGALGNGVVTIATGNAKTLDNTSGGALSLSTVTSQTWNDNFTFTGAGDGTHDLNMGSGAVALGGAGTARTVTVNAGTLTVGAISSTVGSGIGLTKAGAGKLAVDGNSASSIDGDLNVTGGNFAIGDQDFSATGLAGSGTIENGSSTAKTLIINNPANKTFSGVLQDGSGGAALGLTKQNDGTLTLSGASTYTGVSLIQGGTVVLANTQALGATSVIRFLIAAPSSSATLEFATDGGDALYKGFMNSGSTVNIVSNRATPGAGIVHTLTTSSDTSIDGWSIGTINFTKGSNVTSGTAGINFNEFNLGAGGGGGITTLFPTTATVTIGSVTKNKNAGAQTLDLSGTNTGNQITGAISNGTSTVSISKSSSSTWTLSGNSTYTGTTSVNGGTLLVNGNNSAATGAVSIASGATLGGTGTIGGAITNNGTIAPGASVGTLSVNANVTDGANSHWAIELSGTSADQLAVTGDIDLSAVDSLDVTGAGSGSSWIIGTYTGSLTGTFDTVTSGYTVSYTGGNITLNATGLPGDFNSDGKVDAGDYVTWRKNNGTNHALANDGGLGTPIGTAHYNLWRAHFGQPPGSGSSAIGSASAVPEPATYVSICLAAVMMLATPRARSLKPMLA